MTKIGKKSSKKNRTGPRPVYNEDDYDYNPPRPTTRPTTYNEDYYYYYDDDDDDYSTYNDDDNTNGQTENAVAGPVWEDALLTAFVGDESTTSGVVGGRSESESESESGRTSASTEKFAKAQGLDQAAAADRFEEVRLHDGRGGAAGYQDGSTLLSSRNELAADATTFQQVPATTGEAKQGWWIGGGVVLLLAILLVLVVLVRELVRACRRRRRRQQQQQQHHKEVGLPRGIEDTPTNDADDQDTDEDTLVLHENSSSEEEGRTYQVEIDTGRVLDFKKSIDLNRHRGSNNNKRGGTATNATPTDTPRTSSSSSSPIMCTTILDDLENMCSGKRGGTATNATPTDTPVTAASSSCSPITNILDDLEHMCNGCGILGPSLEPSAGVGLEDLTLTIEEEEEERAIVFQQPHM